MSVFILANFFVLERGVWGLVPFFGRGRKISKRLLLLGSYVYDFGASGIPEWEDI